MKRKPDAMIALIALFFVGLVVSGFSSLTVGSNRAAIESTAAYSLMKERPIEQRPFDERTVSR